MNRTIKTTLGIVILAIIGYLASFFVPTPPSWIDGTQTFHWTLANSVLYTLLHSGAAILFLIGIGAYKATLRVAYIAIAIGTVLVGAGLAQVVFLNAFGLIESPWVQYGGVMLPFVAAGLAIYLGTRSMAKLVGVASSLTKLQITLPLLILSVIAVSLLPHAPSSLPESYFDIACAISVWDIVLYGASLSLVIQIKNRSGAHYTKSMLWLAAGLIGSVVTTLFILIGTLVTGEQPAGYILDALVIMGGFLYFNAGLSFARTKEL